MLIKLSIKNFALIDDLEIEFAKGLNILTGETGAGKSIIIDAIGIIVGERASFEVIRSGETLCEVEAIFDYNSSEIDELLLEYGADTEDKSVIINRQLTDQGRSYCRVNGRSVPVSSLKRIGKLLLDIHGQHQHQSLLDSDGHVLLLDSLGDQEFEDAKANMCKSFSEYTDISAHMDKLKHEGIVLRKEQERLRYEVEEIGQAALKVGEDALLEEQRQTLENSERIVNVLDFGYSTLYEAFETPSIIDNIGKILNQFEDIKGYFKPVIPALEYMSNVLYELEDLAANLRSFRDSIDFDMGTLDDVCARSELLDRLKKKYRMSIDELIKYKERAAARLEEATSIEDRIEALGKLQGKAEQNLKEKALILHDIRKNTATKLEYDIAGELADLGMKDIKFAVDFKWDEHPDGIEIDKKSIKIYSHGFDRIEFLISTNPGEPLKPLSKIISGGEASRIMLALKNIMARVDKIPCLIFDEIDSGIGGRAAQTVGEKLSQISKNHQTLCITHSPQIASQGDAHFLIAKEVMKGKTFTKVTRLDKKERVDELARMLGGSEITDNALAHAREMLDFADNVR